MFKKKFKLMATVVGLVAVLMVGLATSGVTQQQPENPWARSNVINMLQAQFARLTAAEGEPILNVAGAIMWSDPLRLIAFVPPLSASLPIDKLRAIAAGEETIVTVGGLYVGEDRRERGMRPGVYKIKLVGKSRVILVDEENNEIYEGRVTHFEELAEPSTDITLSIICVGECLDAGSASDGLRVLDKLGDVKVKICFKVTINLGIVSFTAEFHVEF